MTEISEYAGVVLDEIKRSKRSAGALGGLISMAELQVAFGEKHTHKPSEQLQGAVSELLEAGLIRDIQNGKVFTVTPFGNSYKPDLQKQSGVSEYVPNAMEMEILEYFYDRTNKGHDKETVEGLAQDVKNVHADWQREKIDEAIKVLIYQKYLDEQIVSSKIPTGGKRFAEPTTWHTVKTYYVVLSGKSLMLLSKRSESSQVTSSVHEADKPYTTRRRLEEVFASAGTSIKIVDNYIGRKTLDYLLLAQAPVRVITSASKEKNFDEALKDFEGEYTPGIIIQVASNVFHGRFIIIDETKFYLIDHSIKDFGSKLSSLIEIVDPDIQKAYARLFDKNWKTD